MKIIWLWPIVAALGFGLMFAAYRWQPLPGAQTPWSDGLMVIGASRPSAGHVPGSPLSTRVRLLPCSAQTEAMLSSLGAAAPDGTTVLGARLRPKLLLLSPQQAGLSASWLQSGRLPVARRGEVIAGPQVPRRAQIVVLGATLTVVGVLSRDVALLADSYLLAPSETEVDLFPPDDPAVARVTLLRLSSKQLHDAAIEKELNRAFPRKWFARLSPLERMDRGPFFLYLVGEALLLLGGTGTLIGFFRALASRVRPGWLARPLQEIDARPRLVWGVHLTYFGLVILAALAIYATPEPQTILITIVQSAIQGGSGPLGVARAAYASGSIPRAASVTFLFNFFLGSVATITLPSGIIPGIGVLLATVRAISWGVGFGPTFVSLAHRMLAHSGTMLLEGEGYILATFFALLIPIALAESQKGGTALGRFGRALLLNLQGSLLVAAVLAVAACYEATELILLAR